ncbi:DUF1093 domain-containing protein [Muricomes intestini]
MDAYNEKGEKESLAFTSSKQLREGAYLDINPCDTFRS